MRHSKELKSLNKIGWYMKGHGVSESRLKIIGLGKPRIAKNGRKRQTFICLCECGNVITAERDNVLNGRIKSCGCYKKEHLKTTHSTHGRTHCRLYRVWASMKK